MGTRSYCGFADLSRSSSSSAESGARVPPTLLSREGTVGSPMHTNRSLVRALGFLGQTRTSTTAHLCPWSSVMIREAIMLKNHTSNGSASKGSPLGGRAPDAHPGSGPCGKTVEGRFLRGPPLPRGRYAGIDHHMTAPSSAVGVLTPLSPSSVGRAARRQRAARGCRPHSFRVEGPSGRPRTQIGVGCGCWAS